MKGRARVWRRRGAGAAANLALLATVSGVVTYAVAAQGYTSHRAELNDGGIWVTNSHDGFFGRINKPIGQQDAATFATLGDELDVVQEGSVVVGVEGVGRQLRRIDPATATTSEGQVARLPKAAETQIAGGSLAVLDLATGSVRAVRVDPASGAADLQGLDDTAGRLARVGTPAALAVSAGGTVYVASAKDDTLTRLAPAGAAFTRAVESPLDVPVTDGVAVTTVGETPVVLDTRTGDLVAQGGVRAVVDPGAVLQEPGPDADSVLLATDRTLVSVDLGSGELTTVQGGLSGRPTPPVRLGACVYAAWSGGQGTVVTQCGADEPRRAFLRGEATDLVFRVNRGQIVLNDRYSGRVWNVDVDEPTTLDDWPAFSQKDSESDVEDDSKNNTEGDRRPPKAEPDTFGARPGRTTVLHPLDNDSAPAGRVLAIRAVDTISRNGATVSIGPDGQTVQLRLPADATGSTSFEYFIDDGRQISAHATVTVATRRDSANEPPTLREGFKPRVWPVPAGGSLELPVLPDWRDQGDGDALTLVSAAVAGGAQDAVARPTATGRLRFVAPTSPGEVTVSYGVSDGRAEPVSAKLTFRVQDANNDRAVAAVAEPDITTVEAGRWVTLRPLANDLPGADPLEPRAQLALAGRIAAVGDAQVRTDLAEGTVSFRATVPKTYSLGYDAAFGNAPLAHGRIRVDVTPRESQKPVAMPDTVTLFGGAAALVDVLANDTDPSGRMLVVQRVWALHPDQVDVAVVDGRWLRVSAREGRLRAVPQIVRYAVSSGGPSVVGEVTVNQRPAPDDNAPVTADDEVKVRAGAAVSVAALDNDYSPSGDPLTLVTDVAGEKAGRLSVTAAGGSTSGTGEATVAGRLVRYVAPEVTEAQTYTITYVASNSAGETSPGQIRVAVLPAGEPNAPPEPPVLEARTMAGGTVELKVPGAGVDPDGDPVSVIGLGSAPRLGRVVKLGANTIEYQAFPGVSGTDEFDYVVTDTSGLRASGTARVAVAPTAVPQPPLAVPDVLTVEPGRVATVLPIANDVVAPGDRPTLELVDPPTGVRLESPTGPVTIEAPDQADGTIVEVVYRLSNGLDTSQSTITLRTATPYNNPPVVFDAFGASTDSASVRVDVLRTAYDPDGPTGQLRVTAVLAPPGVSARVVRDRVVVTRSDQPLVVPFRIEDADGGAAIGQVFVPPRGSDLPYVKRGALIRLGSGESLTARLSDYVVIPEGGPVRLAAGGLITGSPAASVNAVADGASALRVTAADEYAGPGAVTFEVAGASSAESGAPRVLLTIPVQVGQNRPVLTCPDTPVDVPQGGRVEVDVRVLCRVWTPDPEDLGAVDFTADWLRSVDGLALVDPTGTPLVLAADSDVPAGREGVMLVRADGGDPARVRVRVVEAPAPSLSPIRVLDLKAGESRLVDLATYLTPGVPNPVPTLVRVSQTTDRDVQVSPAGGSTVRVTAGPKASGLAEFRVVMSDVASATDPNRQASNILSVTLLGVPDTPAAPVPDGRVLSGAVRLSWRAPAANGSPIDYYELRASNGETRRCPTTRCEFDGLTNGKSYTFTVRAHNALGWSEVSPRSRAARPDAVPGVVGEIEQTRQDDHNLAIAWSPPAGETSPILRYEVTWKGGRATPREPFLIVDGLVNGRDYTFTVRALNAVGYGEPRTSAPYHAVGPPGVPSRPTIEDITPDGNVTATLLVTWPAVPANGVGAVTYTLLYDGFQRVGCTAILDTQCLVTGVPYDGKVHRFSINATTFGKETSIGPAETWTAIAKPLGFGAWSVAATGNDDQGRASFTVPSSRGDVSVVQVLVNDAVAQEFADLRTGAAVERNFSVPNNDRPHSVQLKICNESLCTLSDVQMVQTYGPLVSAHLESITSSVSGTSISWEIRVDTNGAPAKLDVVARDSGRPRLTIDLPNVNKAVVTLDPWDVGFDGVEEIAVTLYDDTARDRGPVLKRDQATTPPPPDPVVSVSRSSKCSDEAGSSLPPCHPPGQGTDCLDPSCGFVGITVRNFFSDVTCVVTTQGSPDATTVGPFADNSTGNETTVYFGTPGDWVKAACTDTSGNIQASDKYTWPG